MPSKNVVSSPRGSTHDSHHQPRMKLPIYAAKSKKKSTAWVKSTSSRVKPSHGVLTVKRSVRCETWNHRITHSMFLKPQSHALIHKTFSNKHNCRHRTRNLSSFTSPGRFHPLKTQVWTCLDWMRRSQS
eukprot:PhF_6_TR22467/c0_g1_i2/m.31859